MAAKIEYKQKEIHVFLDGEIDHHSACLIRASIDDAIIHKKPSLLVLDFRQVSFMDSSGLAVVAGRKRLCESMKAKIYITNISGNVRKIMLLSGGDKLVEIVEDQNESR